jgi:hypothetical protein
VTSSTIFRSHPGPEYDVVIQSSTARDASQDAGAIATPVAGSVIVKLGVAPKVPPGVDQNPEG